MPRNEPGNARDRAAEIDSAISGLTGATGLVSVVGLGALAAGVVAENAETPSRAIEFVGARPSSTGQGDWLPFGGEVGELSARGAAGETLLVGLGAIDDLTAEQARIAATAAGRRLSGGRITVVVPAEAQHLIEPLVDGLASGYDGAEKVQLLVKDDLLAGATAGVLSSDTVRLVRRLVSAPANVLTPETAAAWALDIAGLGGLECTVLDADDLVSQGFGALAAIGGGSANRPRLVRLTYAGSGDGRVLSLVGKGITFDSGGLSLKSPAAMQTMRLDVAGAATVLAVMGALARANSPVTVHAVLPFAENLPGTGAVRPGDVVTAWNGTQIQILDTDFEGRVILADALALAAADGPDLLVDLATLTYQAEVALGPEIAAVLGRDDDAASAMLRAAGAAGEPMWRLPWAPRYLDQVRTPFGVRNHPLHDSGRALTAALFLGEFVPTGVPWVHCDMTGPSWRGDASGDGATGFGARTLLRLISDLA